jgi:hypothetical protein
MDRYRKILITVCFTVSMQRGTVEAALLVIAGLCMLSYLLPPSMALHIGAALVLALCLIGLLALRSIEWHHNEYSPYDIVLIAGLVLAVLYLFSFFAFERSVFTFLTVALFAVLYFLLAGLLWQYRTFVQPVPVMHRHARQKRTFMQVDHAHDPRFRRGIQPILEHEPPRSFFGTTRHDAPRRSIVQRIFRRKAGTDTGAFRRGVDPIPVIEQPHAASVHAPQFYEGIEPIPDAPPTHVPATKLSDHHLTEKRKEHIREELFRRGMEPIHEMAHPTPGKKHAATFVKGVEPLKEFREPRKGKKHDTTFRQGSSAISPVATRRKK